MGNEDFASIFKNNGDGGYPQMSQMPGGMAVMMIGGPGMPGMSGGMMTSEGLLYNDDPEDRAIRLPQGMSEDDGIAALRNAKREANTQVQLNRTYRYLPDDGAVAANKVLKQMFGPTFGHVSMYHTPETRTVQVSLTETVQVTWGQIEIPTLDNGIIVLCDKHPDEDYGKVFEIHAHVLKKHSAVIDKMFDAIEKELEENSIYRGKILEGDPSRPTFKDMSKFDPSKYVFDAELLENLEGTLWSVLKYADVMLEEGVSTKRTVLVEGDYGCGKSTLGLWTAVIAQQSGWTVMFPRAGKDNIHDVIRTAKLYGRTLVVYEDIDKDASSGESMEVSELLDAFDGPSSKDSEISLFMTANHPERIIKGMLRPGRIDGVFKVEPISKVDDIQKLVTTLIPMGKLAAKIDYEAIFAAMEGFQTAFMNEAIKRAKTFAIARLNGKSNYQLTTDDFVKSAVSLRRQQQMLLDANEGEPRHGLGLAFESVVKDGVKDAVHGSRVVYNPNPDSEAPYVLAMAGRNGLHPAEEG